MFGAGRHAARYLVRRSTWTWPGRLVAELLQGLGSGLQAAISQASGQTNRKEGDPVALWENGLSGNLMTGLGIGIGATVLAPALLTAVGTVVRPVAKAAIKGGIVLYDMGREAAAEIRETTEDITAEARAELAAQPEGEQPRPSRKRRHHERAEREKGERETGETGKPETPRS